MTETMIEPIHPRPLEKKTNTPPHYPVPDDRYAGPWSSVAHVTRRGHVCVEHRPTELGSRSRWPTGRDRRGQPVAMDASAATEDGHGACSANRSSGLQTATVVGKVLATSPSAEPPGDGDAGNDSDDESDDVPRGC